MHRERERERERERVNLGFVFIVSFCWNSSGIFNVREAALHVSILCLFVSLLLLFLGLASETENGVV